VRPCARATGPNAVKATIAMIVANRARGVFFMIGMLSRSRRPEIRTSHVTVSISYLR
jgi:hypothetical protein